MIREATPEEIHAIHVKQPYFFTGLNGLILKKYISDDQAACAVAVLNPDLVCMFNPDADVAAKRDALGNLVEFISADLRGVGWKEMTTFLLGDDEKHRAMSNKLVKRYGYTAHKGTQLIKEL